MGCLMEILNPHIRIIKKVKVKNMKVILIIIVSMALVYFIYKLCMLKYEIILYKGVYKSDNEPVYITANRQEIDENPYLPIPGNDAIYTKPCKKLSMLTYSKCKDSTTTKYVISYPIYKMDTTYTYTDENFKFRVLQSKNTVEETLSSFITPIRVDNLREYLKYIELFKDIKTYRDIETYHNTLVEELITKYNAVVESNSQSSYIDKSNETIKRILDICKMKNKDK